MFPTLGDYERGYRGIVIAIIRPLVSPLSCFPSAPGKATGLEPR